MRRIRVEEISMTADYKLEAAERALSFVEDGMKLGLGTGSTAAKFVDLLAARIKSGLDVLCVPTSEATRAQAEKLGIRLATLDDEPLLDIVFDGADEIDPELRLIKGGGGALLREKIVAMSANEMVVIADHTKQVAMLGAFALPIEIVRFGSKATMNMVRELAADSGCRGEIGLRLGKDSMPFVTDNGNFILDCAFGQIEEPELLDEALKIIPGVVENGLFLGIADVAIIAGPNGVLVLEAGAVEQNPSEEV